MKGENLEVEGIQTVPVHRFRGVEIQERKRVNKRDLMDRFQPRVIHLQRPDNPETALPFEFDGVYLSRY